jgi:hypothetical protein
MVKFAVLRNNSILLLLNAFNQGDISEDVTLLQAVGARIFVGIFDPTLLHTSFE